MKTKQLDWKPVIKSLLQTMEENKYKLIRVDDGEGTDIESPESRERATDLICSFDKSNVFFETQNKTRIRLYIVLGNSPCETVFDHSLPRMESERQKLDRVLEEWSDSWEGLDCPTVEDMEKDQIIVEVRGGIAYCDDPRVKIIDHDNE